MCGGFEAPNAFRRCPNATPGGARACPPRQRQASQRWRCSRSWPPSRQLPSETKAVRPRDAAPTEPRGRAPQSETCLSLCWPWPPRARGAVSRNAGRFSPRVARRGYGSLGTSMSDSPLIRRSLRAVRLSFDRGGQPAAAASEWPIRPICLGSILRARSAFRTTEKSITSCSTAPSTGVR